MDTPQIEQLARAGKFYDLAGVLNEGCKSDGLFVATDNTLSFTQGGQVVNFNMSRNKDSKYGLVSVVADNGNGAGRAVFDAAHITKLDRNLAFVLGEVAEMQAYIGGRDGVDMADAIGTVVLRQLSVPMEAASAPNRGALTLAQ